MDYDHTERIQSCPFIRIKNNSKNNNNMFYASDICDWGVFMYCWYSVCVDSAAEEAIVNFNEVHHLIFSNSKIYNNYYTKRTM